MSGPDQERPNGGDDDGGGGGIRRENGQEKQGGDVCEKHAKKGKRVSRFRFRKLHRRNKLPSSSSKSCCFIGKREKIGGCFLCCRHIPTVDSPVESQESDPSGFTFEILRSMIEKNDFFSKECNTHLD